MSKITWNFTIIPFNRRETLGAIPKQWLLLDLHSGSTPGPLVGSGGHVGLPGIEPVSYEQGMCTTYHVISGPRTFLSVHLVLRPHQSLLMVLCSIIPPGRIGDHMESRMIKCPTCYIISQSLLVLKTLV